MKIDDLTSQISFSFGIGMNHFTEIVKMRAARMIWAKLIKQFDPKNVKSLELILYSEIAIDNFCSQDSLDNLTRMAIEATAAVMGGTQSLEINSFDDRNLPKNTSVRAARNMQLFLQNETKITKTVDPWAGSFYVESLTNEIVQKAWKTIEDIENIGGINKAIASGIIKLDFKKEGKQSRKIEAQKREQIYQNRDVHKIKLALDKLSIASQTGKENLLELAIEALRNRATFDEIANNCFS
jgi:methylmalonyl-CoA mutase